MLHATTGQLRPLQKVGETFLRTVKTVVTSMFSVVCVRPKVRFSTFLKHFNIFQLPKPIKTQGSLRPSGLCLSGLQTLSPGR